MDESDLGQFAARLGALKGDASVAEFARRCELGDSIMRKYLNGAEPGKENIEKIWRGTGCDLIWLLTGEGDPFGGSSRHTVQEGRAQYQNDDEFVLLPHYDLKASAGLGIENGSGAIKKKNAFRREWWQRQVGVAPADCFSMDIVGDSMYPRLTEAHVPIIQRVEGNEMAGDGIYVFRLDGEVYIKYLERRPVSGLIARSENEKYTPWEIGDGSTFGEFKIIGRVIRKMIVELP